MFANRAQMVVQNVFKKPMVTDLDGYANILRGLTKEHNKWRAMKSAVLMLLWSKHWQAKEAGVVSVDSAHPDNLLFLCEPNTPDGLCNSVLTYEVQRNFVYLLGNKIWCPY